MACSLSYLPSTASAHSTPISPRIRAFVPGKLGFTRTSINVATFFPVGNRLQSNVSWSSPSNQRLPNGVVVRAESNREGVDSAMDGDQKLKKENSPFGVVDPLLPKRTMRQMVDVMEANRVSVRTPWDIVENEDEVKMRFDMPGLSRDDVKVSVVEDRVLVIEEREEREKDCWPSHIRYHTRLVLPENYETSKIKTELKIGVLNITIPKVKVVSKMKDHSQNREAEKMLAEYKNGVLNITIPPSKVVSKVTDLSVN